VEYMEDIIKLKLKEIEEKEQVRIIYAVESGSRAWGFASPDSDYDVRFIYVRKKEFYLKLEKTSDVIEWQLDETFDINGWDLKKALQLLHHSNPTLFEWGNSPIVYQTTGEWDEIKKAFNSYFIIKTMLYHYISTATRCYYEYFKQDKVKLKKYFYVLRPILASHWILNKKTPPPILFDQLVEEELEDDVKTVVEELVLKKKKSLESDYIERVAVLDQYIERNMNLIKETLKAMEKEDKKDYKELNNLFLKIIDINY